MRPLQSSVFWAAVAWWLNTKLLWNATQSISGQETEPWVSVYAKVLKYRKSTECETVLSKMALRLINNRSVISLKGMKAGQGPVFVGSCVNPTCLLLPLFRFVGITTLKLTGHYTWSPTENTEVNWVNHNDTCISGLTFESFFRSLFLSKQLQKEPTQQIQLKAQALIYPVLQALDLYTPSYQQNQYMPILPRTLMVRFWSEYFTSDKAFFRAMMANTHNNPESSSLLKFVNWSAFLPETYHRKYNYSAPAVTEGTVAMDGPSRSLADPRASPLLVPDAALRSLPKAYILTCEYDVLRDDGIMYATRLRAAGVEVTHEHYDTGFHGALMFTVWPTDFLIARRMTDNYIKWLKENL